MMKKDARMQRRLLCCIVFWIGFIWMHSAVPAVESSRESRIAEQILEPVLEVITGEGNVTEHLVRKLAHFFEYTVLGLLMGMRLISMGESSFHHRSYAFLCIVAIAVADESIQLLADGRSAQVTDILLDSSGGLAGLAATVIFGLIAGLF